MQLSIINEPWIEWLNNPLPPAAAKIDVANVLNRAELLIQADYLEQALDELNAVLQQEPQNTYALFVHYCCNLKLGLFAEADEDIKRINLLNKPSGEA
jgi:tetratricopeptide (TPR) repeat protein